MLDQLLTYCLQYGGYLLQLLLLTVFTARGHWRRNIGVFLYLVVFVSVDSAIRPYTLHHYGFQSRQYLHVYWFTDVVLTILAFALVCEFFRRACAGNDKIWQTLRPMLGFVFLLLAAISYFMIASNKDVYWHFIFQFQRNTYFTCLVLTTLLYIMMQRAEVRDEELGMLVCGMGILFAAPTAGLAGKGLLPDSAYMKILINHISQLCMLGMLSTWWYAVAKFPNAATVRDIPATVQGLE